MEPLDAARNDEGLGSSRRRISSILKAPRRSVRFPEPEQQQQENVVERTKPMEKRNSRRVSFATANEVLLFSKDVKNTSPDPNTLQELITTANATQNRVQVAATEDQQIMGMETLLNAPLHASQHRDKVNFDSADMEKTMIFSTDDAFMDMTHSHTINIGNDADISFLNSDSLPARGEKRVMVTANDGSMNMTLSRAVNMTSGSVSLPSSRNMDSSAEKTASCLDPGFQNFLASLSKPSGPSVNPVIARVTPATGATSEETNRSLVQIKTQRADVDKENQAPVSAVTEKSLNPSRKIGGLSYRSAPGPEDDSCMDMTECHTQACTDDDDPFQCLFPTQEMYSSIDNKASQTAEKTTQQQTRKTLASFNPKDMTSLNNQSLHASHQRHKVNLDAKDECRDKTVVFTAGDEFMDMTQSQTVNIARCSADPPKHETCVASGSANDLDLGFKNFLSSLSKPGVPSGDPARMVLPTAGSSKETVDASRSLFQLKSVGETVCPESDVSMDMTEAQTGRIMGATYSDDAFQFLFPTQDNPHCESVTKQEMTSGQKNSEVLGSFNRSGMETLTTKEQRNMFTFDTGDDCRDKTVRFSADDAAMDMTQCLTVNIGSDLVSDSVLHAKKQEAKKCGPSINPVVTRITPAPAHPSSSGGSLNRHTVYPGDDVSMDVTEALTGCISGITGAADDPRLLLTQDKYPQSGSLKNTDMTQKQSLKNLDILPSSGEKTVRFTADGACMDVTRSHTVNIAADIELPSLQNKDILPSSGEKTVRFTADGACMDVTRSHTVNIAADIELPSLQNVDILPSSGEKTVRFTADGACMDVTRSHTVNIAADIELPSLQNKDILPLSGEKTVRFTADGACMDVTRSHTVNIAADIELPSLQNKDILPLSGEKTVRFTADHACMDVTRSHTVNIAADIELPSLQNVDILPACGEKTVRFSATDAAMDETRSHTATIASNSVSESLLPHRDFDVLPTHENADFPLSAIKTGRSCRNRSSSALGFESEIKNVLSRKSGLWSNPVVTRAVVPAAPSPQLTVDTNVFLDQLETQTPDVDTVSAVMEKPVNKTMTECQEDDVFMDMTEGQTGRVMGQTYTDELPQVLSSTQDSKNSELTAQQSNEDLGSSSPDGVQIPNLPDSLDSNETSTRNEHEPRIHTCTLSQMTERSPRGVDVDAELSRKSRRMSLADLQSKVRRLSHLMTTAPDTAAMNSCTAPLPSLERDMDKNSDNETISHPPVTEPELEMGLVNTEEDNQAQSQPSTPPATPFNLKTKQLMSRLSVGNFKAKLPQRSKPDDPKKGEHTRTVTVNVTNQLSNIDDLSNIYNEELGSCEDMSETLDVSPQTDTHKVSAAHEFNWEEPVEDNVFEQDFVSAVHVKKRPLPVEEVDMEDEKRMKISTEATSDVEKFPLECDSNASTAPSTTTQTTDYSNSSRCEATFESTLKQSMFESQLEDYNDDLQRKLNDGTITVSEFFKLFNIDFVIHNPRQSILPGRLMSDADCTPMDLLKDRHINHPKQMVYEADVLHLTEVVEGLKERMQDLDKPLKTVNLSLWEEVRNSSGQELKPFGAKLKERNNLFRKRSKAQLHDMKEALYSNLVQANLEQQLKLTGKIEEADEMMKSLDDCIHGLEAELAAVEEKGFEGKPSLRTCQEEMQKVTEALANSERRTSELEMQKKQSSDKVKRLRDETRNLESYVAALNVVNEWKFGEKTDNCTVFTFLYETLRLQLVYEKSDGNAADNQSERKMSNIALKFQVDVEKSQDHACLVHKLLSQYFEGTNNWVETYPTREHVPKLLHDVGLVVGRCRLLGEELRLLKMWGGMKLDVLSITCVDTQVHIVFSSLKTVSKFELIFSVALIDRLYVLQLLSFKNIFGGATIQQIEEIMASFSPGRNLLTKIVKKIHERLLS